MKNRTYALISTAVIILLWGILAPIVDNPIKLPAPWETVKAFGMIITDTQFLIRLVYTVLRFLVAFGIAFVSAVILGMLAGFSAPVYYFLRPIVLAQRAVPTIAVILLALIWIGKEIAPVLVCFLVAFPIIYSTVVNAIRNIDSKLMEMADIYHLSKKRKLVHLYLPSIRSALASVSAAVIGLTIKVNIAAEVLSQPRFGVGTEMVIEKMSLNIAGVLAWAIITIILAGSFEWLVKKLFNRWIISMTNHS